MAFGVTPEGFARKTFEEIEAEVQAQRADDLGDDLIQEGDALFGQIDAPILNALSELWEVAEATYASQYPDSATNQSLDNVATITGSLRRPASPSTVLCDVNIDGLFTLLAGSVCFVPTQAGTTRFVLDEDVENLAAGAATFLGVAFTAEETGPTVANAGTLTGGPELVTGWNTCTNPADATLGKNIETDSEFRLRRLTEVAGAGGSTLEAIRADVSRVPGVTAVSAIENTSDIVDVNGLPAHSFEVIALGGTDEDVAQAIFDTKPAGILAFGTTTIQVTNSEGDDVPISFSRPTEKEIHLEIDVSVDAEYVGDTAVAAAVAVFGDATFNQGDDVVLARLNEPVFSLLGVRDLTEIRAGFATSPTETDNLVIVLRELSAFDTVRILITSVPFVDF